MEYTYGILYVNRNERWITIWSNDALICEDPDSFRQFVELVRSDIGGEIVNVGDMQYSITNDPCRLIYQWDGAFGISVVYPSDIPVENVEEFLGRYIDTELGSPDLYNGIDPAAGWDESEQDISKDCCGCEIIIRHEPTKREKRREKLKKKKNI